MSFSGKGLWNVKLIAPRDEPIFSSLIASSAQARKAVHLWLDEVEDLLDGVARQKKRIWTVWDFAGVVARKQAKARSIAPAGAKKPLAVGLTVSKENLCGNKEWQLSPPSIGWDGFDARSARSQRHFWILASFLLVTIELGCP